MAFAITLPEDLLAEVREAALTECRSVDEVLQDAVKKYLGDRSWTKWLDSNSKHAEAMGIQESDVDRMIAEYRAEQPVR